MLLSMIWKEWAMSNYSITILKKNDLSLIATISKMETEVNKEIEKLQLKGGISE